MGTELATICIECLRCRHRGIVDAAILQQHGLSPDVSLTALSRRLVCQACGSKALRANRACLAEASAFLMHA
jgi:DNA-directed RNA polymerase subunit RPC12/RpoP